ncbi:venom allergen 5.02-like [Diorhabda sublineata]|uniref:venom allergen 5.02-like n=1 Tax=Diorhabda sublineata TaxID=1163346 RepID=UPI0024E10422|nr:venom allergen 5.02-like [Diorhabda sublineata]
MTLAFFKLSLLCLTVLQLSAAENIDYCQLSCDGISNTACDRKQLNCGPGSACGYNVKTIPIDRNNITNLHNFYRSKVATGNEKRKKQPSAANMNAVTYNTELEHVAQCWANACTFAHDHCRRIKNYKYVGQNVAILYTTASSVDVKAVIAGMVKDWYDEVAYFNPAGVNYFAPSSAGHYTQMVWANTKEIGCGMTYYRKGWNHYLLVCNYGPGGNIIGMPMYEIGPPASRCQRRSRHKNYAGLCLA